MKRTKRINEDEIVTKDFLMAPFYENPDGTTTLYKIGGTTYEVTVHFNPEGRETVFDQFKDLILNNELI